MIVGLLTILTKAKCSSHIKERMAQFLENLEVFLVPVLDVDGLGIVKQNVK